MSSLFQILGTPIFSQCHSMLIWYGCFMFGEIICWIYRHPCGVTLSNLQKWAFPKKMTSCPLWATNPPGCQRCGQVLGRSSQRASGESFKPTGSRADLVVWQETENSWCGREPWKQKKNIIWGGMLMYARCMPVFWLSTWFVLRWIQFLFWVWIEANWTMTDGFY